jgi:hypothetical protein
VLPREFAEEPLGLALLDDGTVHEFPQGSAAAGAKGLEVGGQERIQSRKL